MNKIRRIKTRRSNKSNDSWEDPEIDFLVHDRASPLMLGEHQVGLVVPRVDDAFQIIPTRAVILDVASDYRTGGGLWFDPRDTRSRGKAKGARGRRKI